MQKMNKRGLLFGLVTGLWLSGCANGQLAITPAELPAGQLLVSVVTASSPAAAGVIAKGQQICRVGEDLLAVFNADTGQGISVIGQSAAVVAQICQLVAPTATPVPLQAGLVAVATPVRLPAGVSAPVAVPVGK
jgi:hypothetical protein